MHIEEVIKLLKINIIKSFGNLERADRYFSGKMSLDEFIFQIIFEATKEILYDKEEERSIRSFLVEQGEIERYQSYKRLIKYANHYKKLKAKEMAGRLSERQQRDLKTQEMDNIDKRLEGHLINKYQFYELQVIEDLEIIKDIVSKRITDVKKISNKEFVERFSKLDEKFASATDELEVGKKMSELIAQYNIERTYSTDLVYQIATYMEQENIEDIPIPDIGVLFVVGVGSVGKTYENRFILQRQRYITDVFKPEVDGSGTCQEIKRLLTLLHLKATLYDMGINDLIRSVKEDELVKYILDHYESFKSKEKKEWTNKKIRLARKAYDTLCREVENPKIRT